MAEYRAPIRPKNPTTLLLWLENDISRYLDHEVQTYAHGGTALTLLGIKDSTKDVDFTFTRKDDFYELIAILNRMGYNSTYDFKTGDRSHLIRLKKEGSDVDIIDLHWPYWNNWRITKLIERDSIQKQCGKILLKLLDHNAIFLFKTYLVRVTDIDDLRTVIEKRELDEDRLIAIFNEQDEMYRKDFNNDRLESDPARNVIDLRARVCVSLHLIGNKYRNKLKRFAKFADKLFNELDLGLNYSEIAEFLQKEFSEKTSVAELLDDEHIETLRRQLSL